MKATVHPDVLLAIQDHVAALKITMDGDLDKKLAEYRKLKDDVDSKLEAVGGLANAKAGADKILEESRVKAEAILSEAKDASDAAEADRQAADAAQKAVEASKAKADGERAKLDDDIALFTAFRKEKTAELDKRETAIKTEEDRLASLSASLNDKEVALLNKAEKLRSAAAGL